MIVGSRDTNPKHSSIFDFPKPISYEEAVKQWKKENRNPDDPEPATWEEARKQWEEKYGNPKNPKPATWEEARKQWDEENMKTLMLQK